MSGQWQDIDTAPKDGQIVLLAKGREQGVAFFREGRWQLGGHMYFSRPTHWMPLPEPPTPSTAPAEASSATA
jgi:hypothetical protein